jgi:hypothetical protein
MCESAKNPIKEALKWLLGALPGGSGRGMLSRVFSGVPLLGFETFFWVAAGLEPDP